LIYFHDNSSPHPLYRNPLLHVSHKFREETLRLRPLSFPRSLLCRQVAPPMVPFDLATDWLIVPQEYFNFTSRNHPSPASDIQGLDKLSTMIISGSTGYSQDRALSQFADFCKSGPKRIALVPRLCWITTEDLYKQTLKVRSQTINIG